MNAANTAQPEGPSSHPQAATLEFRNVSKTYEGSGEPAIQDLSFEVPAGDICVLVGPSGCGKTTAMRLVNRMIEMTSGDILVDGVSVRTAQARRPAPRDRLRDPADRPLPAPDDRREHRHRPARARLAARAHPRPRRRAHRAHRPRSRRDARPLPRAALRRPAPARRRGPRPGRRPAADAHGRAVRGRSTRSTASACRTSCCACSSSIRKTIVFVTHDINEAIKLGDRVAVLKKGGVLAQYATPAELLMAPADDFVEDFVGADRALKRLALTRVGELDLRPVDNGLPLRSSATRRADRWRGSAAASAIRSRTVGSDESLRDVLSELLLSPLAARGGDRRRGSRPGRARRRAHPRAAGAREPERGRHERPDAPRPGRRRLLPRPLATSDSCVANNGFCPDWIVHHLDRYVSPFWQHLFLVVVSVGLGFAIAFALALRRAPPARGSSARSPR